MNSLRPRYQRLKPEEDAQESDAGTGRGSRQHQQQQSRDIPWGAIRLALVLLLTGVILLVLGGLHLSRHIVGKDGAGWGLVVLGSLTFIPGFHQSRIAYYAWRGRPGYSFDDIPHIQ